MKILVSHNIVFRRKSPKFYENVDMVRLNSPWYSKKELEDILKEETIPKFLDINLKVRLKPRKGNHDFQRLLKLANKYKVEWIGISNVESGKTYDYIKGFINNNKTKVCAKIETEMGCWKSEDIIHAFDGVMVDTEDLAFDIGWNRASEEKDRIYEECEKLGKDHFRLMGTIFEFKEGK